MKVGRNDPCPCGSGEKYKKCCLGKRTPAASAGARYRQLSAVHDKLVQKLSRLANELYGSKGAAAAMDEFLAWPESYDDISKAFLDRQQALFWPWYLFNWELEPDNEEGLDGPTGKTLPELYVKEAGAGLDAAENNLLRAVNRKPCSFWEASAVAPGTWIELRDILTGACVKVYETTASEQINKGDILFGRVVMVDGVGMLIGIGGTLIPQNYKPDLIMLRKKLRGDNPTVSEETLWDWDVEIRDYYFQMDRHIHEPPELTNTDGHPLVFHRLVYDIDDPEVVFERLAGLCETRTPEQLRLDADLDTQGHIQRLDFPWNRPGHNKSAGMDNTVLGEITLRPDTLTVEVNSDERAGAVREEIAQRLGEAARLREDEIRDMASVMTQMEAGDLSPQEQDDMKQDPEIREKMAEIIEKHWRGWVDQAVPALDNQTPRQAVQTADGREAVAALLATAEKDIPGDAALTELNRKGVEQVRRTLGIEA